MVNCTLASSLIVGVDNPCCNRRPQIFARILAFSLTGYIGASCLKALRNAGGALLALCTTTGRKCATLFLSAALFPKPFGSDYWAGTVAFFLGTLLHSPAMKVTTHRLWLCAYVDGSAAGRMYRIFGLDFLCLTVKSCVPVFPLT